MASIKNILFLFAILVSSTIILAQNPSSNGSSPDAPPSISSGEGSSEEPPQSSSASGPFNHFAFKAPKFDWPQIPGAGFFTGGGSRQKRAVGRSVIRCNYATEGGFKCTGCHSVRRCYPFNMGTDSTCSGLFQYCNNGQCSMNKGPLCSDSTTTSATTNATTVSTADTTTAATTTVATTTVVTTTKSNSTNGTQS